MMAFSRRETEFNSWRKIFKKYSEYLTPYAFQFVQQQYESVGEMWVIGQKSSTEFSLFAR